MELRTEEEQIAAIKKWWKRNGSSLLLGIAVALGLVFGWQAWQRHQAEQQSIAGSKYQQLLSVISQPEIDEKQAETIGFVANELQTDFESTPYAVYGTLILASHQLQNEEAPADAATSLQWALSHSETGPLKNLVRHRLAKAQLAAGEADAALETLRAEQNPGSFTALYRELEGDILKSQGDLEGARTAYRQASEAGEQTASPVLNLKMADLAMPEASQ